jgi:putative ABC transport system substrate-binding protein
MLDRLQRRQFLLGAGGVAASAVARPRSARAQPAEAVRRVGVLSPTDDANARMRHAAMLEELQRLGWAEGRNLRIDARWSAANAAETSKNAAELAALAPDIVFTFGSAGAAAMLQVTQTVPIVFAIVPDPVGAGYVKSLSRPGGNATGFLMFEYSLCAKWVQLLKEIAPEVTRAAVLRDPLLTAGIGQFAVIQSVAPSVGIDVSPINLRDAAGIERDIAAFAAAPKGGLISTASALAAKLSSVMFALAARHKLPAVYQERSYVTAGGLVSYGPNFTDQFRRAARYIDRILRGEKPADLPVQAPTRYELAINLKTAKALGLAVPPTMLARADEVIE